MSLSRWPVHLAVVPGESLWSWLRRIGAVYGCSVADLLCDLGFSEVKERDLNRAVPAELVAAIATKTGMPVITIERTTFAGNLPFLDGLVFTDPVREDAANCSVLFESPNPAPGSLSKLRQWFRKEYIIKINGCRQCLADYSNGAILLGWGLKVVLSCPIHGLMIEFARKKGEGLNWVKEKEEVAPQLVCQLDRRSLEAVSEGSVQLPGGLVSASQWFRIVQTIFHELNAPLFSVERARLKWQLELWNATDYYPPGPFETFKFDTSCALLIATAIDQIEKGAVKPTGIYGNLFCDGGKKASLYYLRVPESERERFRS